MDQFASVKRRSRFPLTPVPAGDQILGKEPLNERRPGMSFLTVQQQLGGYLNELIRLHLDSEVTEKQSIK
jgi:hypothetical protein